MTLCYCFPHHKIQKPNNKAFFSQKKLSDVQYKMTLLSESYADLENQNQQLRNQLNGLSPVSNSSQAVKPPAVSTIPVQPVAVSPNTSVSALKMFGFSRGTSNTSSSVTPPSRDAAASNLEQKIYRAAAITLPPSSSASKPVSVTKGTTVLMSDASLSPASQIGLSSSSQSAGGKAESEASPPPDFSLLTSGSYQIDEADPSEGSLDYNDTRLRAESSSTIASVQDGSGGQKQKRKSILKSAAKFFMGKGSKDHPK